MTATWLGRVAGVFGGKKRKEKKRAQEEHLGRLEAMGDEELAAELMRRAWGPGGPGDKPDPRLTGLQLIHALGGGGMGMGAIERIRPLTERAMGPLVGGGLIVTEEADARATTHRRGWQPTDEGRAALSSGSILPELRGKS